MEKTSEFIDRNTVVNEHGVKQINAVACINELYSRIISLQSLVREMSEALGDYGKFAMEMEDRVNKLEGGKKIEVVSPDQMKIMLK